MDEKAYKIFTQKIPPKKKSRTRPLPKPGEKYLEAFDRLKEILDRMEIKYEEYFHFKTTKHWRFDLHLVGYLTLIEIAGGPWSGGRKGKLATKEHGALIVMTMLKKWDIGIYALKYLISHHPTGLYSGLEI